MVGHGGILAFDERTDMRALARHLLEFGAHESCGKCFPCRIGLQRAFEMVDRPGDVDRERLEALLETLELGSLCAHGGGMPAPIRSLIEHFPDELGLSGGELPEPRAEDPYSRRPEERREDDPGDAHEGRDRRPGGGGRAGGDDPRRGAGGRPLRADALLRRPHGAVRRLPRVHGRHRGRRRAGGRLHHALPRRHAGATPTTRPRAASPPPPWSSCCRSCPSRPREHTELAEVARLLRDRRAALAGRAAPPRSRPPPSLPGAPARALHLVRALRARLRRDPGRVRAHRHRAAASTPASPPASTAASSTRPACRAARAPTPAPPTRSPSTAARAGGGVH